jgi:hypothetical protein
LASFKVTIDRETFTITIDDEYYDDIVNHFKQDNISTDDIYNTNKKSVILGAYINSLTQKIQNDKELKKIIDSIPIK